MKLFKNLKCILNVSGFGLVEILLATGLGTIFTLASLKTLKLTDETTRIVKTDLEIGKLSEEVKFFFSNEENCKSTLKPKKLSDKTNQAGFVKQASDGTALLKSIGAKTFAPFLEIKGLELINNSPGNSASTTKTLAIYYTKSKLRNFKTLDGAECSSTNKSGCYSHTCIIDYSCSNDECSDESDYCIPVSCHKGKGFQGVSCEGEFEYLRGINSDGQPDCVDLECSRGEAFSGFADADGDGELDKVCIPLVYVSAESEEEEDGEDEDGEDDEPEVPPLSCPTGQFIKEIKNTGEIVCVGLCEEKQSWNGSSCECKGGALLTGTAPNKKCECPVNQIWSDTDNECKACPDHQVYDPLNKKCVCPDRKTLKADGTCGCEESRAEWANGRSEWNASTLRCECKGGSVWDANTRKCKCPDNGICCWPNWHNSNGVCCHRDYVGWKPPLSNRKACCHKNTPYRYSNRCNTCPKTRPILVSGGRCVSCSGGSVFNTSNRWFSRENYCKCPFDRPVRWGTIRWGRSNSLNCCPTSEPFFDGNQCVSCTPSGYYSSTSPTQCRCYQSGYVFSASEKRCVRR